MDNIKKFYIFINVYNVFMCEFRQATVYSVGNKNKSNLKGVNIEEVSLKLLLLCKTVHHQKSQLLSL